MKQASERLQALARRIVDAAHDSVPLKAALLVGSAGRGDADFYSDVDLILYVDELPPREVVEDIRRSVGGVDAIERGRTAHFCGEEFQLDGVRTEVSWATVARLESRLDQLLVDLDELDTPLQTVAVGLLEGLPLYGEERIEAWRHRLRAYPDALRRTLIERNWRFFPLWYHQAAIAERDAELWRVEVLLEASFNLLAVLAALNRLYFTRFELKRMRKLTALMEHAPSQFADRLEGLFRLEPEHAATALEELVDETRLLVWAEYPDLELPLAFPPGVRRGPWTETAGEVVS